MFSTKNNFLNDKLFSFKNIIQKYRFLSRLQTYYF
jgi:hypothetical protein